ncbi:MAG: ABC transporter permease [Planctomycetota bacterium]
MAGSQSAEERAEMVRKYGGNPALGERPGKYAAFVSGGFAIPLALGDYLREFRVVGTTPDFFEKLRHGPTLEEPFSFREGRAFEAYNAENRFFEAVLGWRVADQLGLGVGDTFQANHGDPEGKGHGQGFIIVGVLAPTGTPNDRAAFVNLEGFYLLDDHAKPLTGEEIIEPPTDAPNDSLVPLSIPEREVTSILVRNGNLMFAPGMQNMVNESLVAQAAAPAGEIDGLMRMIVGPLLTALLVITLITCVVAAVGVLVAIYNSMNDRRRDIAVMRALGARRDTVTGIILLESFIIAMVGAALGFVLAHVALWLFSGEVEDRTGVQVGLFTTSVYELYILPLVLLLALVAGLLPAWSAYRTDVGTNLAA